MSGTVDRQTGGGAPPGEKDRQKDIDAEIEHEIDEAAGDITSSAGEEDPGSAAEDFVLEHMKRKQHTKGNLPH